MKLNFDFSEWKEFGNRLAEIEKFDAMCQEAVRQLAKELHTMLVVETPVKTGRLRMGWQNGYNYAYKIKKTKTGYEIELINKVNYALSVNDGHYSHNQHGGPYEVKNRTVPYTQGKSDSTFVFGHFFVEKSILQMDNGDVVNAIIYKEVEKWFRWCVDGK